MKRLVFTLGFVAVAATAIVTPLASAADTIAAKGTFTGASEHITTGGVTIVKTANGGAVVILDTDFSLDGAPDPRVGFGTDGAYVDASDLGELTNLAGLQVYVVPPSVNVDDFNEVYIWCKKFAVPLGIAALS